MNTTDADGNFLSYTAVPYTQEIPDGDTNDDTQGKEDSGNTTGGTSNDSTQSGESTGNSASESSANASEQDSGSTQSGAQTSGNSTVETGDAAMTGIYAVLAVVSIGLLIAAAVLKKRKRVLQDMIRRQRYVQKNKKYKTAQRCNGSSVRMVMRALFCTFFFRKELKLCG